MTTNNATAAAYETALNAYTMANVSYQSYKTKETEALKVLSNVRAESASLQKKVTSFDARITKAVEAVEAAKTDKAAQLKQADVEALRVERANVLAELTSLATAIERAELKANAAKSGSAKAETDKAEKAAQAAKAKQVMEAEKAEQAEKAEVERLRAQHEVEIAKLKESMELAKTQAEKPVEENKQDESEELATTEESKGFIEQMINGENIALALNKKFMLAFEKMKDQQGMRELKNIVLALVIYDKTGKYATDLSQVKKYISAFSPFDVRVTKRADVDGTVKHLCRLIQKRDTDFWPKANSQYWDKIVADKASSKKAPSLEKLMKQVEELELSDTNTSDKFSFFIQVAKKLGFDSMVSYEAMEARLLDLVNKAA